MKNQENQKPLNVDEQKILAEIEASFCDADVFEIIESHITTTKTKELKQA